MLWLIIEFPFHYNYYEMENFELGPHWPLFHILFIASSQAVNGHPASDGPISSYRLKKAALHYSL